METNKRPKFLSQTSNLVHREPSEANAPTDFDIVATYNRFLEEDSSMTMPVAAVEALVELLSQSRATTVSEYLDLLQRGSEALKTSVRNAISLSAGCDLFQRWVVRTLQDASDFEACKRHFYTHGKLFVQRARASRDRIAKIGLAFIQDDSTIFVHSFSRVVTTLLLRAAKEHVRFKVVVPESRPDGSGLLTAKILRERGIPVAVILDASIGYAMKLCDIVFAGAEGVLEDGGVVSKIGTYPTAVMAKTAHKPFYAVAESHKFVRIFPLSQYDLPTFKPIEFFADQNPIEVSDTTPPSPVSSKQALQEEKLEMEMKDLENNPDVEYTPPGYITGLITDLGVLTPSGVSEELIKLYAPS